MVRRLDRQVGRNTWSQATLHKDSKINFPRLLSSLKNRHFACFSMLNSYLTVQSFHNSVIAMKFMPH